MYALRRGTVTGWTVGSRGDGACVRVTRSGGYKGGSLGWNGAAFGERSERCVLRGNG